MIEQKLTGSNPDYIQEVIPFTCKFKFCQKSYDIQRWIRKLPIWDSPEEYTTPCGHFTFNTEDIGYRREIYYYIFEEKNKTTP